MPVRPGRAHGLVLCLQRCASDPSASAGPLCSPSQVHSGPRTQSYSQSYAGMKHAAILGDAQGGSHRKCKLNPMKPMVHSQLKALFTSCPAL